jgi:hypothetical protein
MHGHMNVEYNLFRKNCCIIIIIIIIKCRRNILNVKPTITSKLSVFCDVASYSSTEIYQVSIETAASVFMVGDGSHKFLRIFGKYSWLQGVTYHETVIFMATSMRTPIINVPWRIGLYSYRTNKFNP